MIVDFKYGDRCWELETYRTYQEKEAIICSMGEVNEESLDKILCIFKFPKKEIKNLSLDEKLAILYKYREISIGEKLDLTYTCKKCGRVEPFTIDATIVEEPIGNEYKKYFKDQYRNVNDENFESFLDPSVNVDDLDLDFYQVLKNEVKNNVCSFNFIKTINCPVCKTENFINLRNISFCVKSLTEDSVSNFFQTYNDLVYYGHYSKLDIDSMYPYERKILKDLLSRTIEEINKKRQEQNESILRQRKNAQRRH